MLPVICVTAQPWCVQIAEKARTTPADGRTSTTAGLCRMRPPPTGIEARVAIAEPPDDEPTPYAFAAVVPDGAFAASLLRAIANPTTPPTTATSVPRSALRRVTTPGIAAPPDE